MTGREDEHLPPTMKRRSPITLRGVVLGAVLVAVLAALTPYNDYVVANTFLIGGYLPLFLVLAIFVLVVLINAPLYRFAPAHALQAGELATIVAMILIACAVPTQGLFRYFLPMLVAPFRYGAENVRFWDAFQAAGVPEALFPVNQLNSEVVSAFHQRLQPGETAPYAAWLAPLALWGIFLAAMFTCLVSLAVLLRRQWAVNERLPFPLAQLTASLIETPERGRFLNATTGSRLFWVGLVAVFVLHGMVGLNRYYPKIWPPVSLDYNFYKIMGDEPWTYFHHSVKTARIFFTFIGIAYFIQSRTSFSLWTIFLLADGVNVTQKLVHSDIPVGAWQSQHMGAAVAFCGGFLWIGRKHWSLVLRSIFRRGGGADVCGESLRLPALCAMGSFGVMLAWMLVVGMTWWVALVALGFLLLAHLVTARVVAETGLCFVRTDTAPAMVTTTLPPTALSGNDVYFQGAFTILGSTATRESALVFSQSGLVTADRVGLDDADKPRQTQRRLLGAMALALVLSVVVSAAASLWCYYNYATPLSARVNHPMINHIAANRSQTEIVDPMVQHAEKRWPPKAWNVWGYIGAGFGITVLLQVMSLRYQAWPLMPVGYLLCSSWYIQMAWFSLMLGWLAKTLILKFGGPWLYQGARPLFVGLIFGEALAATFWLVVNIALAQMGHDYDLFPLLPQ
jgi:hypothetical protein